jgi:reverse gyrase
MGSSHEPPARATNTSCAGYFRTATGREPFDYQRRLATKMCADGPKSLPINVPTGAGKTVAARVISSRRS